MNILVTGGLGFIGSNFLNTYVNKYPEHNFFNLDNLTYASNFENINNIVHNDNYNFIKADISIKSHIDKVFNIVAPDWIVHFAAESHVDRSITRSKAFIDTNVIGTYNILEAFRNNLSHEKQAFIHISTDEVYGELGELGSFSELSNYSPNSPYSASKAASDHLVKAWFKTYNLPTKIINCSNNYGPNQFPEKFIPLIITNSINGYELPVYGNGKNIRDWLYVNDHCEAIWKVAEAGNIGETYNVGGGYERTNNEVINLILTIMADDHGFDYAKLNALIKFVDDRPGHDYRYSVDSSKINNELNWLASTPFDVGIRKTINWYMDNKNWWQNIKNGNYNYKKRDIETLKLYHE